jgi:hypothetical protein
LELRAKAQYTAGRATALPAGAAGGKPLHWIIDSGAGVHLTSSPGPGGTFQGPALRLNTANGVITNSDMTKMKISNLNHDL